MVDFAKSGRLKLGGPPKSIWKFIVRRWNRRKELRAGRITDSPKQAKFTTLLDINNIRVPIGLKEVM
jgi:hypothetical protein